MRVIPPLFDQQMLKRAAAQRALDYVKPGMKLGLGTGSTAEAFLELLAERMRKGLSVVGVPTSQRTADKALSLGIPLEELDRLGEIDLAVDGADEADAKLNLIKGGGGALLREKIVAASAKQMLVIADETKLAKELGTFPLPVEVVPFGHATTARRIAAVATACGRPDLKPALRVKDYAPFLTDGGNVIYDCAFVAIADPPALALALSSVPGVVDHGLFVGLASRLIVAGEKGVREIERKPG